MTLRGLFALHAVLTFAAALVLIAAPAAIPSTVGIRIEPGAHLLCYLLAAMELGIAALSWGARNITDTKALRLIVMSCIVVHAASALLEVYAFAQGGISIAIWGNIALRVLAVALFSYFGKGL